MTELEAANLLLEAIGSDAVNSLSSDHPDIASARRVLKRKATMELTKGWWFNTDWDVTYPRDGNDEITIPSNLAVVRFTITEYLPRNGKLYDNVKQTYKFTEDQTAYQQIRLPLWDEMDGQFQIYVAYLAAVEFVRIETGDTALSESYGVDAGLALRELKKTDLRMKGLNMFNGSSYRKLRGGVRPYVYRNEEAGTLVSGTLMVGK